MSRGACSIIYKIGEGNFRLLLTLLLMTVYVIIGALTFQALEHDNELVCRQDYASYKANFTIKYPEINAQDLEDLLELHTKAAVKGFLQTSRMRWDFSGSLYFTSTMVSTIGYGMTTPITPAGKIFCIIYGFFGCAGYVLIANLNLERIIVLWTVILKAMKRVFNKITYSCSSDPEDEDEASDEDWKPTIGLLLLVLTITNVVISVSMATVYMYLEGWTFLDSLYFCFVTFTTIGFGDMVTHQQDDYHSYNAAAYIVFNALMTFLGCACMYSHQNVLSIQIKEVALTSCINGINRKCPSCYIDPKMQNARRMARRVGRASFNYPPSSRPISAIAYGNRKGDDFGNSFPRHSISGSMIRRQYEDNIKNVAMEADSNYDSWSHTGSHTESLDSTLDETQKVCSKVSSRTHTPMLAGNRIHPERIVSASEPPMSSPNNLAVESRQFTRINRELMRLESCTSVTTQKHLNLFHRRDTFRGNDDIEMRARARPKSKSCKHKVGGMNVVRETLFKVNAVNNSGASSETDEED